MCKVLNKRTCSASANQIYIGRPQGSTNQHFGNPFSHLSYGKATITVENREEAVQAFEDWLEGKAWQNIEPQRRQWILNNLSLLRGRDLVCWCAPLRCHGEVLVKLANA